MSTPGGGHPTPLGVAKLFFLIIIVFIGFS
jgi:hypothetical protein